MQTPMPQRQEAEFYGNDGVSFHIQLVANLDLYWFVDDADDLSSRVGLKLSVRCLFVPFHLMMNVM